MPIFSSHHHLFSARAGRLAGLIAGLLASLPGADLKIVPDLGLELVSIAPGRFLMGSPPGEAGRVDTEGPRTPVTISTAFWLGKHEVTHGQWKALMGTDLIAQARLMLADDTLYFLGGRERTIRDRVGLAKDALPEEAVGPLDDDVPMYWVNWFEAAEFCRRLTARERAAGRLPADCEYRLPTEAEWEFACRAGTVEATYAGDLEIQGARNAPRLDPIAWYAGNSNVDYAGKGWETRDWTEMARPGGFAGPHKIGLKQPNAWGLFDMLGNVNEWCGDWYAERLGGEPVVDPAGPATGTLRVIRGGSWFNAARSARAANRDWSKPGRRFFGLGFRVALARELSSPATPAGKPPPPTSP